MPRGKTKWWSCNHTLLAHTKLRRPHCQKLTKIYRSAILCTTCRQSTPNEQLLINWDSSRCKPVVKWAVSLKALPTSRSKQFMTQFTELKFDRAQTFKNSQTWQHLQASEHQTTCWLACLKVSTSLNIPTRSTRRWKRGPREEVWFPRMRPCFHSKRPPWGNKFQISSCINRLT